MPPYSGAKFQVLLRAHLPNALVELTTVTAREWESSPAEYLPSYPSHSILGRIRNSDVELFENYPALRDELLSLGFTVRRFDENKCMSIYADTEVKDRTLVQKLQDQLYEALKSDGWDIGYGLVAATPTDMMLVVKFDRQRYNPQNPCPETITSFETTYNTIGYILDNDVFLTSPEPEVKRFYLSRPPWVIYKLLDKTVATEYARYHAEQKEEKVRQHKREKRKAKKKNADKATEQEKQGVLEANGKDTRRGGKSYKKLHDLEPIADTVPGAEDRKQRVDKQAKISLHNLTISGTKQHPFKATKIGQDKLDTKEMPKKNGVWNPQWRRDARIAEIKKPGWFFSGEDVFKDG
ncbi:hypothetical protein KCU81_g3671, partial [Aureobasidium melanogenum]|uniref:Uncharacterized protein n=1 Tax=Aureobasidium melanogenum (strain CBS 110374) TaxID=1043003 RepID=A0A074WDJ6_AURM1